MTISLGAHDEMMMGGGHGWMMVGWMFVWLLVVFGVLAVVVFAIVRFSSPRTQSHDDAREILRRRYAAGDIDKDEFTSRLANLDSPG